MRVDEAVYLLAGYGANINPNNPVAEAVKMGIEALEGLPSAQPEIIRCKDCKYQDENWRRVSVRWLPCMDVRTGSNWYCGSAER